MSHASRFTAYDWRKGMQFRRITQLLPSNSLIFISPKKIFDSEKNVYLCVITKL